MNSLIKNPKTNQEGYITIGLIMFVMAIIILIVLTCVFVYYFLVPPVKDGIKAVQKYANEPVIERANVIGNEREELFIDKGGKKFYAEIDGVPIIEYIENLKK